MRTSDSNRWWRGWLDPRDVDSWLQLLPLLLVVALVVVLIFREVTLP